MSFTPVTVSVSDSVFVRTVARLKKIEDTKDDGVYAKMYAEDVAQLLAIIDAQRALPVE